jgi:hypothetical protein
VGSTNIDPLRKLIQKLDLDPAFLFQKFSLQTLLEPAGQTLDGCDQ